MLELSPMGTLGLSPSPRYNPYVHNGTTDNINSSVQQSTEQNCLRQKIYHSKSVYMLMEYTPLIIAYKSRITLYSSSLFSSYTRFNDFKTTTPLISCRTPPPLIDNQTQQSSSCTALVSRRTPPPLTDDKPQQSISRTALVSRCKPPPLKDDQQQQSISRTLLQQNGQCTHHLR